ncbi:MAG: 3'-5' exonuclease [Planctomycetota bacterium]|jgi:DNA polymerase III epsilon subunit-like protein
MKPYVSIDIETTGLDHDRCQIIEVGAVIDDWTTPFKLLPTFRCYVDHGEFRGQPFALSLHPKIFRYIATNGKDAEEEVDIVEPDCVGGIFQEWLGQNGIFPHARHITPAGKNFSSFDLQFLNKLPDWEECVPTQHRAADPGNLYWDPRIDLNGLPDTLTCMKRAGLQGEVAHTATEDAMIVVKLIRNWFINFSYAFKE